MNPFVQRYCLTEDLSTYDPYDVWKTGYGMAVKKLYNRNRIAGLLPASLLTLCDTFFNEALRLTYRKQEYPVVRAFAALTLLNSYENSGRVECLDYASRHLDWLVAHVSNGYSGACWGIGFDYPVAAGLVYDKNTPFTTNTLYPLEAFVRYNHLSGTERYSEVIRSVFHFFKHDIPVIYEDEKICITGYGPFKDRIVTNAVSYTMFSLTMLLEYLDDDDRAFAENRIRKHFHHLVTAQDGQGAWLYSPEGKSFIDCFHSCFVLKNIIKTNRIIELKGADEVVRRGYGYLKSAMYDEKSGLFHRFAIKNKPGIVKFDLYDNAEALGVSLLMGDFPFARNLQQAITSRFVKGNDIYSQIDNFGFKRNRNTLRWAVMPYLYAISEADRCMQSK